MSRDEDYIRDACRQTEAYSKEALRARLGEGILFTGTWAGATDCQELDEEELLEGELSASGETALDSQAALLVLARPAGSLAPDSKEEECNMGGSGRNDAAAREP